MGKGSYITLFSPSDVTAFNRMKFGGRGCYITLFSPSDVTAFNRMKFGGRGCYITLFSPSDVTAFHRIVALSRIRVKLNEGSMDRLLNQFLIYMYVYVTAHPRFFNQLSTGLDMIALAGEWLTATANTNMWVCQDMSIYVTKCQYRSLHVNVCQYMSIYVTTF